MREELQTPTTLLISTPLDGKTLLSRRLTTDAFEHGADCDFFSAASDALETISPTMIFLSTHPKMLQSEHAKCLSKLYNTLLRNFYEFRFTIYNSSDFGTQGNSQKAILFASRIGLRDPPGTHASSTPHTEIRWSCVRADHGRGPLCAGI